MEDYIRALPKAELHLHLEGTIEPPTLERLAEMHELPKPAAGLYQYRDFGGFLQAFKTVCGYLRSPQDYHLVVLRMIERLRTDGVVYAEVYIAAGVMLWKNEDFESMFEGIEAGAQEGFARHGVRVRWILDAVRQFGAAAAHRVGDLAARFRSRGVIGIGIGGDEKQGPPELFQAVYAQARACGLRLTAHAGETCGPESIWGALRILQAERIGHGTSAAHDPELVAYLAANRIPVEACLSSNLRTGSIRAIRDYPLRLLFEAGVPVALSTDDPAMFQTSLTAEYLLAHREFGFNARELAQLARNSFGGAFLSDEERARHLAAFPGA